MCTTTSIVLAILMLMCIQANVHGAVQLNLGIESDEHSIPCDEFKYFKVDATEVCEDLRIEVKAFQGDPDLYVARSPIEEPNFNTLGWISYDFGGENLTIPSWDPEYQIGTYFIGVLAYCGDEVMPGDYPANVTVLVEHVPSVHPHEQITLGSQITGNVSARSYTYYRFCLPASCLDTDITIAMCDDAAICPTSYASPDLIVSRSNQNPTLNSHSWQLADSDNYTISLNYDDRNIKSGHYFVAVYGWCTPDELCHNLTTCYPCSYVDNIEFNVTIVVSNVTENCPPTISPPMETPSPTKCGGAGSFSTSVIALFMSVLVTIIWKTG